MSVLPYRLGCPLWANKAWVGEFFTRKAKTGDFLRQYFSLFSTVEGNTTFYALPSKDTVLRWKENATEDFRFCFKFPKVISHQKKLVAAEDDTALFFRVLGVLEEKLGPFFLQLSPHFGPDAFPSLLRYLDTLPKDFSYAVEVRHLAFFDRGEWEHRLNQELAARGIDRVLFDARGVHSAESADEAVVRAQTRKPRLPYREFVTAETPFVRYIAHPDMERNRNAWHRWAEVFATWIKEGKQPLMFMHTPNDFYAPGFAKVFHEILAEKLDLPVMPPWPSSTEPPEPEQMSLF